MKQFEIYADGACRGNPGPGGWGALIRYDGHDHTISGAESFTTNNRMELMAVIKALMFIRSDRDAHIIVTTDSKYVKDGISSWIHSWKKNNWLNSLKKPVKNKDLWVQLDGLVENFNISWQWVKGHNGHVENELVDQLARQAIESL